MGQFNANNALQNAQYNADLGLKNRSMSMEQAQNNLNNALQAYNTGKATYADVTSAQDALYGAQTDAEKTQMQRYLDMLNIQQGVYGNASGLGGTSSGTTSGQQYSSNTMGNILGGLAGAGGLLSMFKK
jgi:outer membrane protein TolC